MRDDHRVVTFDQIATDLQTLRGAAGSPSYTELVRRVAQVRAARGVPAEKSRPARSTLYDAFRMGRRRIDDRLVADLVRALGEDEAVAEEWIQRCRGAVPAIEVPELSEAAQAEKLPDERQRVESVPPADQPPAATAAAAAQTHATSPAAPGSSAAPGRRPGARRIVAIIAIALLANLVGRLLVVEFGLSLYLDMVGTAIVAVALGPWWGVGVGIATNVAGITVSGAHSLPFALVQIAGALVWGYGVHRFAMGRSMMRFLGLNVLVALVCTAVAAPILLMYGGGVGHGSENIVDAFLAHGGNLVTAVFSANAITSTSDKLISGFIALAVLDALHQQLPVAHRRVAPATDLLRPRVWLVDTRLLLRQRLSR